MRALDSGGSHGGAAAEVVVAVGRRSRATVKQSSRARHWRGWEELGCDRVHACRSRPVGEERRVAATWRGVVCPWLRRDASAIEWVRTVDASWVSVCWIALSPPLISLSLSSLLIIERNPRRELAVEILGRTKFRSFRIESEMGFFFFPTFYLFFLSLSHFKLELSTWWKCLLSLSE